MKRTDHTDNFNFQVAAARVRVSFAETPNFAIRDFRGTLRNGPGNPVIEKYGLVLALTQARQLTEAKKLATELLQARPDYIPFELALVNIEIAAGEYQQALQHLEKLAKLNPGNYPISVTYAEVLTLSGHEEKAVTLLREQIEKRPRDPDLWFALGKAEAQHGRMAQALQARAQFSFLQAHYDQALKHLLQARRHAEGNEPLTFQLDEQIRGVRMINIKEKRRQTQGR